MNKLRFGLGYGLALAALWFTTTVSAVASGVVDTLVLGDVTSEQAHRLSADSTEVIRGGLGEPARRLLPREPVSHNGGAIEFVLKVDPEAQNYLTVKLWGSDRGAASGRLILFIEGQQAGYRHEGDHDVLNQSDDEALFQERFVYQTVVLPPMLTRGKNEVTLRIAGLGPMWPYGTNFAQKQKPLAQPTRGIYRVYTHTRARFEPGADEKQGVVPTVRVRPPGPGEEVFKQMETTVKNRLNRLMNGEAVSTRSTRTLEAAILFLAEAYRTPWTPAYRNPKAIAALVRVGDHFLAPGVIGKEWIGAGPLGEAIMVVGAEPLQAALAEEIELPANFPFVPKHARLEPLGEPAIEPTVAAGQKVRMPRREAWARVLRGSVDWNRMIGRRFYTNQSMIVDRNIYTANRGLQLIDPARALPEAQALRYVYEAVGLSPWLGNDTPEGGSDAFYGRNYFQLTRKGLSRELGFVGTYGETILKFTRDMAELTGDPRVREQLRKMHAARMYFRYPSLDVDGYRTMKLASEIDSRTAHFPLSHGAYAIADIREAWWLEVPAFLQEPVSVGAALQALEDNQYFPRLALRTADPDTLGMMRNIDEYAALKKLPGSSFRLPMSEGRPDFIFSDEENAVLAMKHRGMRLFLNFYYRQEFGVSGVVRFLDVGANVMRLGTLQAHCGVNASGATWTRPDVIDFQRSGGFKPPGEDLHQAWRGEKLPVAKLPEGATLPQAGKWGPFVGKASFYSLRYGDYLFGINTTENEIHVLPVANERGEALDLVSGRPVNLREPVKVGPLSTVVLFLGN